MPPKPLRRIAKPDDQSAPATTAPSGITQQLCNLAKTCGDSVEETNRQMRETAVLTDADAAKMDQIIRDSAGIDATKIALGTSPIIEAMVTAYHQLKDTKTGRLAFYCNRAVGTYLHLQALSAVKNSTLTISEVGGRPVTTFLGIPVRETDSILSTESVVS
jgi:hypothetical protein